jgi:hypothetical protein
MASSRMRPPHLGQVSTSMPKVLRSNWAHGRNRTGMDASHGNAVRMKLATWPQGVMIANSGSAPAAKFGKERRPPTSRVDSA